MSRTIHICGYPDGYTKRSRFTPRTPYDNQVHRRAARASVTPASLNNGVHENHSIGQTMAIAPKKGLFDDISIPQIIAGAAAAATSVALASQDWHRWFSNWCRRELGHHRCVLAGLPPLYLCQRRSPQRYARRRRLSAGAEPVELNAEEHLAAPRLRRRCARLRARDHGARRPQQPARQGSGRAQPDAKKVIVFNRHRHRRGHRLRWRHPYHHRR
ncbi:MAG: hypothetical protein ACLU0O_09425 [Collinsella sp.]